MNEEVTGASASPKPALVSDQAAARLDPTGFDPAREQMLGRALLSVWHQARTNLANHSATGSVENDIRFFALGLAGEAGEVANFVKKRWRDGDGHDEALRFEAADVFAYDIMLAEALGMTPEDLIATVAHKQFVFVNKMAASDRDAACGGDATEIAAPVRSTGSPAREAGSPDSPRENINQINSPTKGKTS